jgi:two-component system, OmpR family, response regulator QseB
VRILLVDDNPHIGLSLSDQLCGAGHLVGLAQADSLATELLKAVAEVDVMILDIGSSNQQGFDLIRDLRRGGTNVPVIILSGLDSTADRVRGLDAGADDYVVKPFVHGELEARLRALSRRLARSSDRLASTQSG